MFTRAKRLTIGTPSKNRIGPHDEPPKQGAILSTPVNRLCVISTKSFTSHITHL